MISVCFQGKPFTITAIQVYAPSTNAEKLKLTRSMNMASPSRTNTKKKKKKKVLFMIGDWNAKVRSQEIPGVTDRFDLGVQNEAG